MRSKKEIISFLATLTLLFECLTTAVPAFAAGNEKILHNFCTRHLCADGSKPWYGSLIFDSTGNLYGTTGAGGSGYGTVFELVPGSDGKWTETVLYNFRGGTDDGASPASGVIFDATGNMYGTTVGGGTYGYGTVFELSPNGGGTWTETVLHSFIGGDDSYPYDSLILDGAGNLYGTTTGLSSGNACDSDYNCGTVFELSPGIDGSWTETVLHTFSSQSKDGWWPYAGLAFDSGGNLYGTTFYGGAYDNGVVFQLTPSRGAWTENIIHSFCRPSHCPEGAHPFASLILDNAGSLYGTGTGSGSGGSVFELIPGSNGKWTAKALFVFSSDAQPTASVVFDRAGILYGTTYNSGIDFGTVFRLAPRTKGKWIEKTLHSFKTKGKDGRLPYGSLVLDSVGNLYGTTHLGGDHKGNRSAGGTVFEITP